jgi:hypothetical protein
LLSEFRLFPVSAMLPTLSPELGSLHSGPESRSTTSTQRLILKTLLFESLEALALGLTQLQQAFRQGHVSAKVYQSNLDRLHPQWAALQKQGRALLEMDTLATTPEAKTPEGASEFSKGIGKAFFEWTEQAYQEAHRLAQGIWQLQPLPPSHEILQLIEELVPAGLLEGTSQAAWPERAVVFCQSGSCETPFWSGLQVESLPVLYAGYPTHWVHAITQSCVALFQKQPHRWATAPLNRAASRQPQDADALLKSLVPHLLAICLVGPAYYEAWVSQSLAHRHWNSLQKLEPMLYHALKYGSSLSPRITLLHEALERFLQEWDSGAGGLVSRKGAATDLSTQVLPKETYDAWLNPLLKSVEEALPETLQVGSRSLERCDVLRQRLSENILIASSSPYQEATQQETFQALKERLACGQFQRPDLTACFERMMELPHTPQEILNTAWMLRLDALPERLSELFTETPPATDLEHPLVGNDLAARERRLEPLFRLGSALRQKADLVRKSLEVARLHRLLEVVRPAQQQQQGDSVGFPRRQGGGGGGLGTGGVSLPQPPSGKL